MKWSVAVLVVVELAAGAWAADPPAKKGLTVHEWGVFRVNTDAAFANAELRAEWDDLPEFMYGHVKGRVVPQHWGAVEIRKRPIIFFHSEAAVRARVKIEFPGGQAGVWYPATERPAVEGFEKQPKIGNVLEWNLGIGQCPNGWIPKNPNYPEIGNKHWVSRIRQVKSDDIYSLYSPNFTEVERDKFLYYDGIFPQGKWLRVAVEADVVSVTSKVKHPVFDVTIIDRRGDKLRVSRVAKLDAGETIKKVEFKDVEASSFPIEGSQILLKQLVDAGLFKDEAESLVDLWKKELFETPGVNLFFRLPQGEYDARLPLTISPKPAEVVRVGLVYQAHLEPDFARTILDLVKQLDSPRFTDRDLAFKKLRQIGPAALVQLQRLKDRKDLSVEVREKIDVLIKKWDAIEAFDR